MDPLWRWRDRGHGAPDPARAPRGCRRNERQGRIAQDRLRAGRRAQATRGGTDWVSPRRTALASAPQLPESAATEMNQVGRLRQMWRGREIGYGDPMQRRDWRRAAGITAIPLLLALFTSPAYAAPIGSDDGVSLA